MFISIDHYVIEIAKAVNKAAQQIRQEKVWLGFI